jgi:uncharacterized protein
MVGHAVGTKARQERSPATMPRKPTEQTPRELERTCGDCSMCCYLFRIPELKKPANKWCQHCKSGKGCGIYGRHPPTCKDYICLWLVDTDFGDEWFPATSKIVIHYPTEDLAILQFCVDPRYPNRWAEWPYFSEISKLGQFAENKDKLVVVTVSNQIVYAKGDFRRLEIIRKR